MKKSILTFFGFLLFVSLFSQTGSIDNILVEQRSDGSQLIDVYFDLNGTADSYYIRLKVSFDQEQSYWPVSGSTLSGDTGPINPGTGKHIIWDPTQDFANRYSPQAKLMVKAFPVSENPNACPDAPMVTDFDGNVYNTVLIGNQCWMQENLNVSRDPSGNYIGKYWPNNNISMCEYYGGLYTWETIMNGADSSNNNPSGVQGICPDGWHIPSASEWTELTEYLINNYADVTPGNIGDKLKSCRQVNSPLGGDCNTSGHPRWTQYSQHYGTNDFGFSGLPAQKSWAGEYGHWSSTSQIDDNNIIIFEICVYNGGAATKTWNKTTPISVRCIKD